MQAVTNVQIRAARELLGLSQTDLAHAAGVSARTVGAIEGGVGNPTLASMMAVLRYFASAGIVFSDTPGVVGLPVGALRDVAKSHRFGASDEEVRA